MTSKTPHEPKLWGGRFSAATDAVMEKFNASISYDKRIWKEDIFGSKCYAHALHRICLISFEENESIQSGLDQVATEWEKDSFSILPSDEDIHTANERRLGELIGRHIAGKLHTGRSRNDQVATDAKLWMKTALKEIKEELKRLLSAMLETSRRHLDIIMPGYTHLQRAQPVRWSHWMMSHAWFLYADFKGLERIAGDVDVSPLGSGAIAGNPFGIDRQTLGKDLGFLDVTWNSMTATSDRDYVIDFLYWCSKTSSHLSRLAEDLILHSTKEFGFCRLDDAFCTGSSLMPQKKNADSLELIRSKAGRMIGHLTGFLTTVKATPSTYNKDLQEDKEHLFDAFDTMIGILRITTGVVSTLRVDASRCRSALSPDMLATDLAYYLVRKGVPFRHAHSDAGKAVAMAEEANPQDPDLTELSANELKSGVNSLFGEDVKDIFDYEASVEQYDVVGGTARSRVIEQIDRLERKLDAV